MNKLELFDKRVNKLKTDYLFIKQKIKQDKEESERLLLKVQGITEAQGIIQTVAEKVQKVAHERISLVVTRCLETIFSDDPYTFEIQFERKRGKTEANLLFKRDGNYIDPLTSSGGGVVDVASFALRLSCLILTKPKLSNVVIMDEPFKFVSTNYRDEVGIILNDLSQELGIQFIMVTHMEELKIGNVIQL